MLIKLSEIDLKCYFDVMHVNKCNMLENVSSFQRKIGRMHLFGTCYSRQYTLLTISLRNCTVAV